MDRSSIFLSYMSDWMNRQVLLFLFETTVFRLIILIVLEIDDLSNIKYDIERERSGLYFFLSNFWLGWRSI